jgi:hypothetical protein
MCLARTAAHFEISADFSNTHVSVTHAATTLRQPWRATDMAADFDRLLACDGRPNDL